MGDFNVNHKTRNTPAYKLLKTFERKLNLKQLILKTTRPSSNSCLDLIFTDMDHINTYGVLDMDISDHLPVFLIKMKTKNPVSKVEIKCRSYANYNKQHFQDSKKENQKWVEKNKPDDMWEIIETIIKEAAYAHCPLKSVKINEDTPNWLDR